MNTSALNKAIVKRFNEAFIQGGDINAFNEIVSPSFINHTAPDGVPKGPEGVLYFFNHFLKPAFPDIVVEIRCQVAEGDKVMTHKYFHATHKGDFMGIAATGIRVRMEVMDILRLENEKFVEHWNVVDWNNILGQIKN